MVHRVCSSWFAFSPKCLLILSLYGAFYPALSLDKEFVGEGLAAEQKHKLEVIKTEHYWYTAFSRTGKSLVSVNKPLNFEHSALNSEELLKAGGVIIGEDERQKIEDTRDDHWCVYGQLTMNFGNKTYAGTGTLISPWHVLTTGRNLYDPKRKDWAQNIQFHPGRNGDALLLSPVSCAKKAIFSNWKEGDEKSDIGIIELSEGIGYQLGWNGLLWGDNPYLAKLDPINVTGYPSDKPLGTMWTDFSKDWIEVYENQIAYQLSASEGQNGAASWVRSPNAGPEGFYSVGVHAYGVSSNDAGVVNVATRLTQDKFLAIIHCINEKF